MTYIDETLQAYPALNTAKPDLEAAVQIMQQSITNGGKLLICGNGGSASDSDHIAGELMKGFLSSRKLDARQTKALRDCFGEEGEQIASFLQQGIPAVSLASHNALLTAILNDQDPSVVFAQQVQALGKAGDVLMALSTSGNSKNVLMAAKVARARGLKIIGLSGKTGGQLAALCDICIKAPATRVDRIQELHLPVYHALCAQLEDNLYEAGQPLEDPVAALVKPSATALPMPPRLIVFDFDGVFTDNKVYTAQDGTETVLCDRRDSLGLNMLKEQKIDMFILTQEANPVVSARARKLGIRVESNCSDKATFLIDYLADHEIDPQKVIYMGNDLNDLAAMNYVGYSVAPSDAHADVKASADLVVPQTGGNGAVRDLCEIIMKNLKG